MPTQNKNIIQKNHHRFFAACFCFVLVLVAFTFSTSSAEAQANPQINYQGKLTNASGVAVPNGTYNMRFWLLTTPTIATTSAVWTESLTSTNRVQVTNGLFSVMLGSSTPLTSVNFNQTLYLGVEIGGTSTPAWDGEMSPRKILGTVPSAFVANRATTAGSASSSDNALLLGGVASTSFLRSDQADDMTATSSGTLLSVIQNGAGAIARFFSGVTEVFTILNNGNVGIGTTTPGTRLAVVGDARITGTSTLATTTISTLSLGTALTAVNGGTGLNTVTQNQLLIGGAGNTWTQVATSSLGLGNNTFLGLTDTDPTSYTANRLFFTNSGATGITDSANLTFDGSRLSVNGDIRSGYFVATSTTGTSTFAGRVGIGTTTPSALLAIMGTAGQSNSLFTISSSTGSTLFNFLANGSLDIGNGGVYYDAATRQTSIESLNLGAVSFATDGGAVSWVDMLIESAATGSVMSYTAQLDSNPVLTVYGESDGSGGAQNLRVGIGSTTPTATLSITGTGGNNPFVVASSSGASLFSILQNGNVGIGSSTPSSRLTITGAAGTANTLTIASSTGASLLTLTQAGNLGLGTTTPGSLLTVAGTANITGAATFGSTLNVTGLTTLAILLATNATTTNLSITGNLFDTTNSAGTSGQVLLSTGTSTRWTATSSLGFVANSDLSGTSGFAARWLTPTTLGTSALIDNGTVLGVNASSSNFTFNVQGGAGVNPFNVADSSGTSLLTILGNGNVGIGTTSPTYRLEVVGNAARFYNGLNDNDGLTIFPTSTTKALVTGFRKVVFGASNHSGNYTNSSVVFNGMTASLQFRANSHLQWSNDTNDAEATSDTGLIRNSAGILRVSNGSSGGGALMANYFVGTSTTASTFAGNVGIGSSTPNSRLTIVGNDDTANTLTVASSSGSTTLAMLANGDLELPGQLISAGINWTPRTAASSTVVYNDVTYGNGTFVSVGTNYAMYSSDGLRWATSTIPETSDWSGVTYSNGLFVAVGAFFGGSRVMTSPDGNNWTARSAAGNNDNWYDIAYSNSLFVVVGNGDGLGGGDHVMTSPDGINWTARSAVGNNDTWNAVTYGNGLFVAVGIGSDRVMTSPDGINWTVQSAVGNNDFWQDITYGNGLFVAVGTIGDRVMTSPDGINWTALSPAGNNDSWIAVTYGNGLFVAVGTGSDRVMTSPDGINWTVRSAVGNNDDWYGVIYGNGLFVAVGSFNDSVMTSGKTEFNQIATNNIFQGGTSFFAGLRAGTTSASVASIFLQSEAGLNPFAVASSTGASLLTLTQAGNLGLGTTTPTALLGMDRRGITGAATAGLEQFFTFANSTASAVQYGNRARLVTTNTATTTMVGNFLTVTDSTTFGNTVRGLEVQADLGTNTQGENTALSGYARTFGVRGVTSGDAGGSFEPAGIYGETAGTIQGNALRGYSSTITSAALVKLFQNSSAFTGTGLLMNFGNSGGSFSSTTASRFIDLQNAGTSRFIVGAYGALTIGDGTTGQNAGIAIGNGGLCVDNDGSCIASTTGRISSVSTAVGNSDLAEMYFSNEGLVAGEVVYQKGGLSVGRASTSTKDLVLGVVSTLPGLIMGQDDASLVAGEVAHPIALAGRVPVLLSNENGAIKAGDELMLSSIAGVAMKATSTGTIIGLALEDFEAERAYSKTFINQFGESIIVSNYVPINRVNDKRINDGCYYGGGSATGDKPCVLLKATTTEEQYDEADALAAQEAKEEALRELAATESEAITLADGREVKVGQIVMFVTLEKRTLDTKGMEMVAALLSNASSTQGEASEETVWSRLVNLANNFIDGVLSVFTLKAERIETNQLCVDGVCINAEDLRGLLDKDGAMPEVVPGDGGEVVNPNPDPTPEPIPDPIPDPLPVPEEPPVDLEPIPEPIPDPLPVPEELPIEPIPAPAPETPMP